MNALILTVCIIIGIPVAIICVYVIAQTISLGFYRGKRMVEKDQNKETEVKET